MEYLNSIANVKNGLIVSCQFDEADPFNSPEYISIFALSAQLGGASGIRTEGKDNIMATKGRVQIPVIGLIQSAYDDGSVLITPDFRDVDDMIEAGADMRLLRRVIHAAGQLELVAVPDKSPCYTYSYLTEAKLYDFSFPFHSSSFLFESHGQTFELLQWAW